MGGKRTVLPAVGGEGPDNDLETMGEDKKIGKVEGLEKSDSGLVKSFLGLRQRGKVKAFDVGQGKGTELSVLDDPLVEGIGLPQKFSGQGRSRVFAHPRTDKERRGVSAPFDLGEVSMGAVLVAMAAVLHVPSRSERISLTGSRRNASPATLASVTS